MYTTFDLFSTHRPSRFELKLDEHFDTLYLPELYRISAQKAKDARLKDDDDNDGVKKVKKSPLLI